MQIDLKEMLDGRYSLSLTCESCAGACTVFMSREEAVRLKEELTLKLDAKD